jgi:hypothetical protein
VASIPPLLSLRTYLHVMICPFLRCALNLQGVSARALFSQIITNVSLIILNQYRVRDQCLMLGSVLLSIC